MSGAKVLHVSAVDFTASKLLKPQMAHLLQLGYDVRVACGKSDDEEHWAELKPFSPIDLTFPRQLRPGEMLRAALRLREVVQEWRPDILHLHTPAASLPVRAMPRNAWPRGMKVAYTVHGYLHQWPPTGRRERLVQRVESWESKRCHLTLFQSIEDFDAAVQRRYGGRPTYLGNGVEDEWFGLTPPHREPTNDLSLLFVGRLVREKGVLDLLAALRLVPGVQLHVVGDALPSDRDSVADQVREMASGDLAGRLHLYGMLTKPQLLELYGVADAVTLPSYREGVPRSVIEALAASRPVLASAIRGNRELVAQRENGLLFPAGDVEALARSLSELRDTVEVDFGLMSDAARRSVDPTFRESQVFRRLTDAYASILHSLRQDETPA